MKNNDRIYKYLDGQLSEKEKIKFESDLRSSASLRNEFEEVKRSLDIFNDLKNPEIDPSYFDNVLSKIKRKNSEREKRFFPRYAYTFAAVIIISISVLLVVNLNEKENDLVAELNEDEIIEIEEQYYDNLSIQDLTIPEKNYDSLFNSLIYDELEFSFNGDMDFIESVEELNENEAELIYNSIINKKF